MACEIIIWEDIVNNYLCEENIKVKILDSYNQSCIFYGDKCGRWRNLF